MLTKVVGLTEFILPDTSDFRLSTTTETHPSYLIFMNSQEIYAKQATSCLIEGL
jgi:hypothetical protein